MRFGSAPADLKPRGEILTNTSQSDELCKERAEQHGRQARITDICLVRARAPAPESTSKEDTGGQAARLLLPTASLQRALP